jgi:hypothetical protein
LWFSYYNQIAREEEGMAELTVEGVPDDVLDRMRRNAEAHGRSLDDEAIIAFERHVGPRIMAEIRAASGHATEENERGLNDGHR